MASRTLSPEELAQSRQILTDCKREDLVAKQSGRVRREDLLSTNELARLWGTSTQTISRWRQYKVCNFPEPYFDDVAACLYHKDDLYSWLKSLGLAIKNNAPVVKA